MDCVAHHLSEDFGLLGSGIRPVRHPSRHQSLGRIGACSLHLGHHVFFIFLEMKKDPVTCAGGLEGPQRSINADLQDGACWHGDLSRNGQWLGIGHVNKLSMAAG